MNRFAGAIFKGFNGNFATPFNTNSRSGPGTHFQAPQFNGNNQFGQISAMQNRVSPNPASDKKLGQYRARVQGERNQAQGVRLT